MSFLKNLLRKKENKIHSYTDFWTWFQTKEKDFHKVVREGVHFERDFFNHLSPKLAELREGFFYLTGMSDHDTVELVLTADGRIKNFVFIEELVESAPAIKGWKFTAHKPSLDIENVNIDMAGLKFNKETMAFQPIDNPSYPDEIEISVIHTDLTDHNKNEVTNGTYIFLDNYLGELNFATTIDYLNINYKHHDKELIPIGKLKDYLTWRQKEFIEKYEGARHNSEHDSYANFQAKLENGGIAVATINTDLLKWNSKASHPWILKIEITYGDSASGMPDPATYKLMDQFEDEINNELKDFEGFLNVGRQTASGLREIYLACKDFRRSSKAVSDISTKYASQLDVSYDIYKDKYWRTFDRFAGA